MVQLEIALGSQQRQLDELRQALANVVDIAVHRLHKEQVFQTLANKANVEQLEQLELSHHQEAENAGKQLISALAKKADAMLFEEQQSLVQHSQGQILALEQQQKQAASFIADISSEQLQEQEKLTAVRERLTALSCRHDELMVMVECKADSKVLEHQKQLLEGMQKDVTLLSERLTESTRQQLSASISAEMRRESLCRNTDEALLQQQEAVTAVKAEMEVLEQKWLQRLESETQRLEFEMSQERLGPLSVQKEKARVEVTRLMEEFYDERLRVHEASLVRRLDKKADVEWFEQHQLLLEGAEVSLTALNRDLRELRIDVRTHFKQIICDKAEQKTVRELGENVDIKLDIVKASIENVSREMKSLAQELGQTRAQLDKVAKRVEDLQATVATKCSQSLLEQQQLTTQVLQDEVQALMQQVKLVAYTQASMSTMPKTSMSNKDADANAGMLVHPPSCPRDTTGMVTGMPRLPGTDRRSPYRHYKRR